ncbi:hypothetical protein ATCC90586_008634 [Pythium insidiosum]|nr:hypothetical protein ATCC90586_008634 [Pythium insidiosum]
MSANTNTNARILVTGASGQLGRATLRHLLETLRVDPKRIIAGSRNTAKLQDVAVKGVEVRRLDLGTMKRWARLREAGCPIKPAVVHELRWTGYYSLLKRFQKIRPYLHVVEDDATEDHVCLDDDGNDEGSSTDDIASSSDDAVEKDEASDQEGKVSEQGDDESGQESVQEDEVSGKDEDEDVLDSDEDVDDDYSDNSSSNQAVESTESSYRVHGSREVWNRRIASTARGKSGAAPLIPEDEFEYYSKVHICTHGYPERSVQRKTHDGDSNSDGSMK